MCVFIPDCIVKVRKEVENEKYKRRKKQIRKQKKKTKKQKVPQDGRNDPLF